MTAPAPVPARPPAPEPAPGPCPNCGHRPASPPLRYCPACGQETRLRAPTLGEFAQQFGGAYLATEGALWRTLKLLLTKPGALTREYLDGRRRHYVLPLRLYLTVSVLVLLVLRGVAHLSIEAPEAVQGDVRTLRTAEMNLVFGRAGLKDGVFFCHDLPAWLCQRVQRRIDIKPEMFADAMRQMAERFVGNVGAAMFVLLPVFALGLKLAYLNRRLRYTEHLVFALHVHAFWFLMIGLTLVPLEWLKLPALLAVPIYTLLALRRVYGGRWWPRLLRAGLVATLYLVAMALAMLGVGLWSFLA